VPRDPAYFGEGIGIGLRRQDKDLKSLFNKALEDLKADGTFAQIRAKYFKFEIN
jgi:polar amino acid transport system substrate-binding protein